MRRTRRTVLLPLCWALLGCHEASKPPATAPEVAEPAPAVIVVEGTGADDAEPPSAPAAHASPEPDPIKVGHRDYAQIASEIATFGRGAKTAIQTGIGFKEA